MAYHIYETEAFVLDERPLGEANKIFYLLTPDLGLVAASAQGIRLLKSKLRFQIAKYARVRVALVRGKEVWRLTGAEKAGSLDEIFLDRRKLEPVVKVFSLLSKFLRGEGEQRAVFADLGAALSYLNSVTTEDNGRSLYGWELSLVLRLLNNLGYIKSDPELLPILNFKAWSDEVLAAALAWEKKIVAAINQATTVSHF